MADSRKGKRKVDDVDDGNDEAQPGKQAAGMAWGPSRALEAARRRPRKDDDEIGFGDFGRYMSEKIRKLREQFHGDASNSLLSGANSAVVAQHAVKGPPDTAATVGAAPSSKIFEGISIFVDGFTIPSHQELRHLMLQYGGIFENYFARSRVTHVICSTLPDSKIKDPRQLSRGLPIVKPSWIVDSIKAGKRLPCSGYELERIAYQHPQQRTLSGIYFAQKGGNIMSEDHRHLERLEDEKELAVLGESHDAANEPVTHTPDQHMELQMDIGEIEHVADDEAQEEEDIIKEGAQNGPEGVGAAEATNDGSMGLTDVIENKALNGQGSSSKGHSAHSTLGDPNFVQNYYKYSRLHFIGTWRNRYKDLFGTKGAHLESKEPTILDPSASPAIIHFDMDCFFVAVAIRDRPELCGKPVAVCHSASTVGTGEISSANYPARMYGVKAGMFVRTAKEKCRNLTIVPYDFEGYEQVAEQVYRILHQQSSIVQAVSCDEAYVDVTGMGDPDAIASAIREEIFAATKCTASAGVGGNMLLARLATKKAKPNGMYHIMPDEVDQFMSSLPVGDLPGVGGTLKEKLHDQGISTCGQLRMCSKDALQRDYGLKTGHMLWSFARAMDDRQVQPPQERKSIGAEVNWGVRFSCQEDAQNFLVKLCGEVSGRLRSASVVGRTLTLKIKKRKAGVGEPVKFMGCGICDNMSRSATVASATDDVDVLLRASQQLFASFKLDVCDVRGVGLQVTRLEHVKARSTSGGGPGQRVLESWLQVQNLSTDMKRNSAGVIVAENSAQSAEPHKGETSNESLPGRCNDALPQVDQFKESAQAKVTPLGLPPASQLDRTVLDCLPADILSEIQLAYSCELGFSRKHSLSSRKDPCSASRSGTETDVDEGAAVQVPTISKQHESGVHKSLVSKEKGHRPAPPEAGPSEPRSNMTALPPREGTIEALPPASQLDHAVLSALPLALRRELEREYEKLSDRPTNLPSAKRSSASLPKTRKKGTERQKDSRRVLAGTATTGVKGTRQLTREAGIRAQASTDAAQFMPSSFTQVDIDVLNELPDDLKREVMQTFSAHAPSSRAQSMHILSGPPHVVSTSARSLEALRPLEETAKQAERQEPLEMEPSKSDNMHCDLWSGSPPKWVAIFEDESVACSAMLQFIASQYHDGQPRLSEILLSLVSSISSLPSENVYQYDTVAELCIEWVRQYSELKAPWDLEEIHTVLRLIKRLASKSKLWQAVRDQAVPAAQVTVGGVYGAKLSLE